MIANYHTHTTRCHHATGTEREYVERAIEGGLKILGFSDHTPYPFPEGHVSGIRMSLKEMDDYTDTVLSLKKEYESDIEIHLGVEVEYYPRFFDKLLDFMKDYPVEYFLLAQHYTGDELEGVYSGKATDDPAVLERYCRQVTEAMETGRFTYLAHPDLINFTGDSGLYDSHMRTLCRNANRCNMPVEINFLGLYEGRNYPDRRFWKIVGEEGCQVIFGADAHCREAVWRPEVTKQAEEMVKKYDLNLIETAALVKPV
ncbi:MAG: histidinol-phosphatase [Lachnospiraceae bacterium]|nr:histidinol-phosphatase [Lachnospiraceae bacterium]